MINNEFEQAKVDILDKIEHLRLLIEHDCIFTAAKIVAEDITKRLDRLVILHTAIIEENISIYRKEHPTDIKSERR